MFTRLPTGALPLASLGTVVFWAMHRHWGLSSQRVDAGVAEDIVVQMISAGAGALA